MSSVSMKDRPPHELGESVAHKRFQMRFARARGGLNLETPIGTDSELLHVLIVDDHRANADTLSSLVTIWGHDVRCAYDGVAGLALAAAYRPDVLLLDILMANMTGFEVAMQVRRQERLHDCFIVAITGRTDESHRCRCYDAGVDLCLIKPVVPAHLQTLLTLESQYVRSRQNSNRRRSARSLERSELRTDTESLWLHSARNSRVINRLEVAHVGTVEEKSGIGRDWSD